MIVGNRVALRRFQPDDIESLRRWHDEHMFGILGREYNARHHPARPPGD